MKLDALDVALLRELRADARLSFRELAERLGSTTPTVSARVKGLEDVGLLRGYRAQLDTGILGGTTYLVTLVVHPAQAAGAQQTLAAMPGTERAWLLPGGRVVAQVHLRPPRSTLAHLHARLAEIPGLQTYDAAEVLQAAEGAPLDDVPEDVEVPCHQCKGPIHGDPVKGRFAERTHVFCCRQCLADFRARFEALAAGSTPRKPTGKGRAGHGHHHGH